MSVVALLMNPLSHIGYAGKLPRCKCLRTSKIVTKEENQRNYLPSNPQEHKPFNLATSLKLWRVKALLTEVEH